jgi:hypothetical protein
MSKFNYSLWIREKTHTKSIQFCPKVPDTLKTMMIALQTMYIYPSGVSNYFPENKSVRENEKLQQKKEKRSLR